MNVLFLTLFCNLEMPLGIGLYSPIRLSQDSAFVAITRNGSIFVLDRAASQLLQILPDGTKPVVARKGLGPGELQRPSSVKSFGEFVFVLEQRTNKLHIFNQRGEFVDDKMLPENIRGRGQTWQPAKNGLVFGNWEFSAKPNQPISLMLWNPFSNDLLELASWPRQRSDEAMISFLEPDHLIRHNPAPARHFLAVSPDGQKAFLSLPGEKLKVHIFDLESGKKIHTFTNEWKSIPFDKEWGEEDVDRMNALPGEIGIELKYKADFPDFMPIVRDLWISAEGELVIQRWMGDPQLRTDHMCFSTNGDVIQNKPLSQLTRVLAIRDHQAYISLFLDDEAFIEVVPVNQIKSVLQNHPVIFEENITERRLLKRR